MARQVQLRRGTTAQTNSFTGAVGEVTVDTDKNTAVVHDGSTAGGHPITPDQTVVLTDGTGISTSGTYPNFTITNSAPDQTVAITGGENVVVTGTYPNFTVASTASGGTHDFVASGAISNGDVVVLNSDGTVSTVTVTNPELNPVTLGAEETFASTDVGYISSVYDPDTGKIIIGYKDNTTTYPMAVVGTVSGSSITFGTPVVIQSVNSGKYMKVVYDTTSNKPVFLWAKYLSGQEEHGQAVVGTVSGTSISFGTVVNFANSSSPLITYIDAVFDSGNSKIVAVYNNGVVTNRGSTAIVGTVSGTSISFGTPTIWNSTSGSSQWIAYDANVGKVLVGMRFQDANNPAHVGTVSGTGISFGSAVTFSTNAVGGKAIYDPSSQKILIVYADYTTANRSTVTRVATISGDTVSFGSTTALKANTGDNDGEFGLAYSPATNSIMVSLKDGSDSNTVKLIRATISGTQATYESAVSATLTGSGHGFLPLAYDDTAGKFALLISDDVDGDNGKGVVITETSTVSDVNSYLGVAAEDIADAATGSVTVIGGVNEGQTGLTVNTSYFLDDDGSLITVNNGRKLGKAVSTTKLLVDTAMSGSEMNEYLGGLV